MKKLISTIMAMILALALALSMTSCGGNNSGNGGDNQSGGNGGNSSNSGNAQINAANEDAVKIRDAYIIGVAAVIAEGYFPSIARQSITFPIGEMESNPLLAALRENLPGLEGVATVYVDEDDGSPVAVCWNPGNKADVGFLQFEDGEWQRGEPATKDNIFGTYPVLIKK